MRVRQRVPVPAALPASTRAACLLELMAEKKCRLIAPRCRHQENIERFAAWQMRPRDMVIPVVNVVLQEGIEIELGVPAQSHDKDLVRAGLQLFESAFRNAPELRAGGFRPGKLRQLRSRSRRQRWKRRFADHRHRTYALLLEPLGNAKHGRLSQDVDQGEWCSRKCLRRCAGIPSGLAAHQENGFYLHGAHLATARINAPVDGRSNFRRDGGWITESICMAPSGSKRRAAELLARPRP